MTTKNCKKGYSCGASCVARTKGCKNPLEGQAKNYAQWLQLHLNKGTELSPFHKQEAERQGIRKEEAASPATRRSRADRTPALPDGVRVSVDDMGSEGVKTNYDFTTASGSRVRMYFVKGAYYGESPNDQDVGFNIDGEYDLNTNLSPQEARRVALTLTRTFQYHASQQADGAAFVTSAWDVDDYANRRALAYMNMGFSRPQFGSAGNPQYATVRNGKVEPDDARVQNSEGYTTPGVIERSMERLRAGAAEARGAQSRPQELSSNQPDWLSQRATSDDPFASLFKQAP